MQSVSGGLTEKPSGVFTALVIPGTPSGRVVCVGNEGSQRMAAEVGGPGLSHQPPPKILSQSRTCKVLGVVSQGGSLPYSRSDAGSLKTGSCLYHCSRDQSPSVGFS